jgi:hypothetical protein
MEPRIYWLNLIFRNFSPITTTEWQSLATERFLATALPPVVAATIAFVHAGVDGTADIRGAF